ncbi:hypothetical protein GBA65_22165 (plasmid) [Rubrobacter marinus]|uniref:Uncharacterized protein n=1 Tax=Rubrobacter marinus TaxID=2653852 RepID=A0A6G8Q3S9_9ACTN|nr:hypothetical protein [Rubrobacter marinus]QIN81141.1 hypothetical protein GBA65_22165 [Rubrobacter marinus]
MTPHDNGASADATLRDPRASSPLGAFLRKCSPEEIEEWHEHGFISTLEYREALEEKDPDPGS